MKYKKLTNEQIIISLDRLTRFKPTREKYLRVFSDIIVSALIEPKLKKNEIERMDFAELRDFATEILNASISKAKFSPSNINQKLKDYENSVFNNDEETQKLLDNNIDFVSALALINNESVVNLRWLKSLAEDCDMFQARQKCYLKFPIEKVLLVEGLTEEILLPAFSKYLGYDFYQKGIQIIPAGGKNQVVKIYYKLAEELKLPIFLLLDKDAEENIKQISPKLRSIDKIHLVSCGEFEDLLPKSLIVKTVNNDFKNFLTISEKDLDLELPNAKILEELFKTKWLHEFKKAEFAKLVKENISENSDISSEISDIISGLNV